MEKVQSKDGTLIAYEKSGNGPALVLVHGTSADHTRWAPIVRQLQAKFTVYAVDRRGRGESGDSMPYSIEREFEDIAAVVDSIQEPVNLLGHSFGAICSLEAARRTRKLHKLILYEPPIMFGVEGVYPPGTYERITRQLEANDRAAVVETFLREIPRVPAFELAMLKSSPSWNGRVSAAHTIPREMRASDDGYQFNREMFSELSIPTLLLLGGDSPEFFRIAIQQLHDTLPNNRLVVMPGQQHVAMNTAPELFLKEVLGFLVD
jgi:pimeloyl-ACP methyl ester carboxylesterase